MEYILVILASAALMAAVVISVSIRLRRSSVPKFIVIPLDEGVTNAELVLREAYAMAEVSVSPCTIILINMGADEETLRICRIFASEHGGVELIE